MNTRKALAGICLLCALAISAVTAQSVSAAGTTAVTCESTPGEGGFSDAHCANKAAKGGYTHLPISNETEVEVVVTNAKTCGETTTACPMKLKASISGIALELKAEGVSGSAVLENRMVEEEHQTIALGTLTFENVTVTAPKGKGCEVFGGKISTSALKTTTNGAGMLLNIEGVRTKEEEEAGAWSKVATIEISGCSVSALNNIYLLQGSFRGTPSGATLGFTEVGVTAQETFFIGGNKVGVDGQLTLSGRTSGAGGTFTPLAFTTTGE